MPDKTKTTHLSEQELVVLNAFFLALPLPPLLSRDLSDLSEIDLQKALNNATLSLQKKGLITPAETDQKSGWVVPGLAQMLRDIAYGNQMLHLYCKPEDGNSSQYAIYHNEGRFVQQELQTEGQHNISPGSDMGRNLVVSLLRSAPTGSSGEKVQFSLEAWSSLLNSLEIGVASEVLAAFESAEQPADAGAGIQRRAFAKDVLESRSVLVMTGIYDRLQNKEETVSFVMTQNTNWLVTASPPVESQTFIWALKVPRKSLLLAAEGIFSELDSAIKMEGRPA